MPHIVWIHGFPLSSKVYAKQLSIAAAQHIAPDLAGFGTAQAPNREYTMNDYAKDILRELDSRKIEKAIFAGLSMGGYIVFALARMAQQRMQGVILIDTRETADTPEARKGRYDTIEKVKQGGVSVVAESMLPKMLTAAAPRDMVDGARNIMMESSPAGVVHALRAMAERPDSTDILKQIDAPALVVVGESDSITPPADAERMARNMRNATLVTIRGAAHLSNFEQPEQFNEAVNAFLQRLERG
ncbi:MAG TPA: alpha/beta fold hydrolase [Thermoanaerobaculia bacterium]